MRFAGHILLTGVIEEVKHWRICKPYNLRKLPVLVVVMATQQLDINTSLTTSFRLGKLLLKVRCISESTFSLRLQGESVSCPDLALSSPWPNVQINRIPQLNLSHSNWFVRITVVRLLSSWVIARNTVFFFEALGTTRRSRNTPHLNSTQKFITVSTKPVTVSLL